MCKKDKCEHKNRSYDLYIDSEITKQTVKLTVPSWCSDCENKEIDDYKEDVLYYKFHSFESIPDCDYEYNSLKFGGFSETDYQGLEYQKDDFDCDTLEADLEVEFESAHDSLGYEIAILKITYTRCSKEEYEILKQIFKVKK